MKSKSGVDLLQLVRTRTAPGLRLACLVLRLVIRRKLRRHLGRRGQPLLAATRRQWQQIPSHWDAALGCWKMLQRALPSELSRKSNPLEGLRLAPDQSYTRTQPTVLRSDTAPMQMRRIRSPSAVRATSGASSISRAAEAATMP